MRSISRPSPVSCSKPSNGLRPTPIRRRRGVGGETGFFGKAQNSKEEDGQDAAANDQGLTPRRPQAILRDRLMATLKAIRRSSAATHRAEMAKARDDLFISGAARRDRTRRLIELGGLVKASGLIDRVGHNPDAIIGALRVLTKMMDMAKTGDAGFSSTVLFHRWQEAGSSLVENHNKAVEAIKREERGWASRG